MSGITPYMQTLVFLPLRGAVLHMREIVIVRVYFYTLLLFDSLRTCIGRTVRPIFVFYGSKDVFLRQLRPFWGENKFY